MVVKNGMSQRNDRKNITSVKTPVTMTNLPNRTIKFGLIPVSPCPCWGVTYDWRVLYPFCCSFLTGVSLIWQFRRYITEALYDAQRRFSRSVWTCRICMDLSFRSTQTQDHKATQGVFHLSAMTHAESRYRNVHVLMLEVWPNRNSEAGWKIYM